MSTAPFTADELVAIKAACFLPEDFALVVHRMTELGADDPQVIAVLDGESRVGLSNDKYTIYFASISKYEQRRRFTTGMQDKRQLDFIEG